MPSLFRRRRRLEVASRNTLTLRGKRRDPQRGPLIIIPLENPSIYLVSSLPT